MSESILAQLVEGAQRGSAAQRALLLDLLAKNRETEFGRAHGFGAITSEEEYRARVPLSEYGDYEPAIRRMLAGERNLLTSGEILYWCLSSGSTAEPKYVPLTREELEVQWRNTYLAVADGVRAYFGTGHEPAGPICYIGEFVDTSMPDGVMSGIRSSCVYQWKHRMGQFDASGYFVPEEVLFPDTLDDLTYVRARFALARRDLDSLHSVFIHKLNTFLRYIVQNIGLLARDMETGSVSVPLPEKWRRIVEASLPADPVRAAELRALNLEEDGAHMATRIWPGLRYLLTIGGSTFSRQMQEMRHYAGDLPVHYYAYASSEGIFALGWRMDVQDSYLLLPDAGYFEFLPLDGGEPLSMAQVRRGEKYEVVITNLAGLYRYRIQDVVEVVDFAGEVPVLSFCYRRNQVISLSDEHTDTAQLMEAVRLFESRSGLSMGETCMAADEASSPPRYLLYAETGFRPGPAEDEEMDRQLRKVSFGYDGCRSLGEIGVLHILRLRKGAFAAWEQRQAAQGRQMGQSKPVLVLRTPEQRTFFDGYVECERRNA